MSVDHYTLDPRIGELDPDKFKNTSNLFGTKRDKNTDLRLKNRK